MDNLLLIKALEEELISIKKDYYTLCHLLGKSAGLIERLKPYINEIDFTNLFEKSYDDLIKSIGKVIYKEK